MSRPALACGLEVDDCDTNVLDPGLAVQTPGTSEFRVDDVLLGVEEFNAVRLPPLHEWSHKGEDGRVTRHLPGDDEVLDCGMAEVSDLCGILNLLFCVPCDASSPVGQEFALDGRKGQGGKDGLLHAPRIEHRPVEDSHDGCDGREELPLPRVQKCGGPHDALFGRHFHLIAGTPVWMIPVAWL